MPDKYSLICEKVKPHEIKTIHFSNNDHYYILIYDGRFIQKRNWSCFDAGKSCTTPFFIPGNQSDSARQKSCIITCDFCGRVTGHSRNICGMLWKRQINQSIQPLLRSHSGNIYRLSTDFWQYSADVRSTIYRAWH